MEDGHCGAKSTLLLVANTNHWKISQLSPWKPSVTCRFQDPDVLRDNATGHAELCVQEALLLSVTHEPKRPYPVPLWWDLRGHWWVWTRWILTSAFPPFAPFSYSNCSGRIIRICFLWNVSAWLFPTLYPPQHWLWSLHSVCNIRCADEISLSLTTTPAAAPTNQKTSP